ncbi:Heterokaryon incompatibility protein (HET) domain containing protein, partial [Rhypophila decipiens]
LCVRCRRIDFGAIFNQETPILPGDGRPVFQLGQLEPDSLCPACQIFDAVALRHIYDRKDQHYHLRVFRGSRVLGTVRAPVKYQPDIALAVVPGLKALERHLYNWMRSEVRQKGFLLSRFTDQVRPRAQDSEALLEGSHVDPRRMDYGRLKGWLQDCDGFHADSCKPRARISNLRVPLQCIDCFTRAIVEIRPDARYFALSYVWGVPPSKIVKKGDPGCLPRNASRVIEDAMVVVRELGERYLWVDKYCIMQDSHDIKSAQIKEMDLIYSCAYATIIASAGSDASFGLPGVSKERTQYPQVLHGRELEILPTRPSLSYAIADTAWITRGWTFQEVTLSRRCLFFTMNQVYFVCPTMDCCEAVEVGQKSTITPTKPRARDQPNPPGIPIAAGRFLHLNTPYDTLRSSRLRKYAEYVTEYTGRTLTYDQDILNAFRGLLSRSPFLTY